MDVGTVFDAAGILFFLQCACYMGLVMLNTVFKGNVAVRG
jgi:hypothetical protein